MNPKLANSNGTMKEAEMISSPPKLDQPPTHTKFNVEAKEFTPNLACFSDHHRDGTNEDDGASDSDASDSDASDSTLRPVSDCDFTPRPIHDRDSIPRPISNVTKQDKANFCSWALLGQRGMTPSNTPHHETAFNGLALGFLVLDHLNNMWNLMINPLSSEDYHLAISEKHFGPIAPLRQALDILLDHDADALILLFNFLAAPSMRITWMKDAEHRRNICEFDLSMQLWAIISGLDGFYTNFKRGMNVKYLQVMDEIWEWETEKAQNLCWTMFMQELENWGWQKYHECSETYFGRN
jgi:hypothetical protein